MQSNHIIEQLNRRHGTSFRLLHTYAHGENQGAYALQDGAGRAFVLKYVQRAGWVSRLEQARDITSRLRERGAPVPHYVLVGELADRWAYCVQTVLPGSPAQTLSREQARQAIASIELQAGAGESGQANWSSYVRAVVFDGESGWAASLRAHSSATRALLRRMEHGVAPYAGLQTETMDIVHGDLALDNVLIDAMALSGIVDWDAAGRGDRTLDLAKLLYYGYDSRPARELLLQHMLALRGPDSVYLHMVYCILAQLDWSIHHHAQAVATLVLQADVMLDDLEGAAQARQGTLR